MKILPFSLFALIALAGFSHSQDMPLEVARLDDQREAAIRKIDATYVAQSEKIKAMKMKAGDLEAAVAVEKRIKEVDAGGARISSAPSKTDPGSDESSIPGEYVYTYLSNGYEEKWTFLPGGKASFFAKGKDDGDGRWEIRGDVLWVTKGNNEYQFDPDAMVSIKVEGHKGYATIKKK